MDLLRDASTDSEVPHLDLLGDVSDDDLCSTFGNSREQLPLNFFDDVSDYEVTADDGEDRDALEQAVAIRADVVVQIVSEDEGDQGRYGEFKYGKGSAFIRA